MRVELHEGLPTPQQKPKFPLKIFWRLILTMFILGLSLGACSLGMKLPVSLFNLAVYYTTP